MPLTNQELEDKLSEIKLWLDTNFPTKFTYKASTASEREESPVIPQLHIAKDTSAISFNDGTKWIESGGGGGTNHRLHFKTFSERILRRNPYTKGQKYTLFTDVITEKADERFASKWTEDYEEPVGHRAFDMVGKYDLDDINNGVIVLRGWKASANGRGVIFEVEERRKAFVRLRGNVGDATLNYSLEFHDHAVFPTRPTQIMPLGEELYNFVKNNVCTIRFKFYQISTELPSNRRTVTHSFQVDSRPWLHVSTVVMTEEELWFRHNSMTVGYPYRVIAEEIDALSLYDKEDNLRYTSEEKAEEIDVGNIVFDGIRWKPDVNFCKTITVDYNINTKIEGMKYCYSNTTLPLLQIALEPDGDISSFGVVIEQNPVNTVINIWSGRDNTFRHMLAGEQQEITLYNINGEWVVRNDRALISAKANASHSHSQYAPATGNSRVGFKANHLKVENKIFHYNDDDTYISFLDNQIDFHAGSTASKRLSITASGIMLQHGNRIKEFSNDSTMNGNSYTAVPTEFAVVNYVRRQFNGTSGKDQIGVPMFGVLRRNDNFLNNVSNFFATNNKIYIGKTTNMLYARCHNSNRDYIMRIYGTQDTIKIEQKVFGASLSQIGGGFHSCSTWDFVIDYRARCYQCHIHYDATTDRFCYQVTRLN